jgi:N-acetylmuramic acid 6-phosphate etherase
VGAILGRVALVVGLAETRMKRGGRLIYVGAGTSGRLGILDASESPPTFGVRRGIVHGVIAGGRRAVTESVEGAEDRAVEGAVEMRRLRVGPRDTVVGLSASGGARYVLAAVAEARRRGAATVAVTCDPKSPLARAAGVALVPAVGPEAVAGSTRLKAGTAQKMILNMLSTCVMARLGRMEGNVMSHMKPLNVKLRDRAVRIVSRALGIPPEEARRRLTGRRWNLPAVLRGAR